MKKTNTEEEEEEMKDGECLGCGCEEGKGPQCLSCGAPVEPGNGSEHYMFGWHDGKREECERDECRVLFCFVLFGLQLSVCLRWLQVPLRDLSDA